MAEAENVVPKDPDALIRDANDSIRPIVVAIDSMLAELGCQSYVKTIYIGYEWQGELVAALYPHASKVELALALPEDHSSALLGDATHLTWKTMPVLVEVNSIEQLSDVRPLIFEAFERVRSGTHDVMVSNDQFKKRDRRLSGPFRPRFFGKF